MIDLQCVATFLAVVDHGGFREASNHTGLSQPAVSQHIRRLEHALNATLIQRRNAGCTLTPKGQLFLPYAQQLFRIRERIEAAFHHDELLIGASSNVGIYLLQPYLRAYRDTYPHPLKLVIGRNAALVEKLEAHEIDMAVLEWWDHRPGYAAALWRSEELVAIVPMSHPWAVRSSIPRELLKGQALLGGEAGTGTGRLLRECWGEDAKSISVSMHLGSTEAVKHAVKAGLGISLVMAGAVRDEVRNGQLAALQIEDAALAKQLYLVRREDTVPNPHALRAIQFLLDKSVSAVPQSETLPEHEAGHPFPCAAE